MERFLRKAAHAAEPPPKAAPQAPAAEAQAPSETVAITGGGETALLACLGHDVPTTGASRATQKGMVACNTCKRYYDSTECVRQGKPESPSYRCKKCNQNCTIAPR